MKVRYKKDINYICNILFLSNKNKVSETYITYNLSFKILVCYILYFSGHTKYFLKIKNNFLKNCTENL